MESSRNAPREKLIEGGTERNGEREETQNESMHVRVPSSFPQGAENRGSVVLAADKTPGREREKGMTGSVKAHRDQGDIR